jgi:transcriptional regulator with XRE-family HTH domain
MKTPEGYWASLIVQIRNNLSMSQEDFAAAVFSNQATVSRWEKGLVVPTYDKQKKIELLAATNGVTSLGGVVEVVRNSPHRIILIDESDFIIAASPCSEWAENKYVGDQLSGEASKHYKLLKKHISDSGFWGNPAGERLEYSFRQQDTTWYSVIVSVAIRGTVYAVVQQTVSQSNSISY